MQIIIEIFNIFFFGPIVNLLVAFLRALQAIGVPGALGFSIILLTIAIRLAIWPLFSKQTRSMGKMNELKPHLDKLKKKHGDDKQAYMKAQMALYKEHGVSPMGGCLPSIIQIPIFIALYQTIFSFFAASGLESINNVLYIASWKIKTSPSLDFFGLNLADKPSDFARIGFLVLLLPVVTALLQIIQSKMMMPKAVKPYPSDSSKEKKQKQSVEDTMASVQSQMVYLMPLMVGFFSFQFPIGLSLYWNTFTIFGIMQQYKIMGMGGLSSWVDKVRGKNK